MAAIHTFSCEDLSRFTILGWRPHFPDALLLLGEGRVADGTEKGSARQVITGRFSGFPSRIDPESRSFLQKIRVLVTRQLCDELQ
jgi:hypothetical protein